VRGQHLQQSRHPVSRHAFLSIAGFHSFEFLVIPNDQGKLQTLGFGLGSITLVALSDTISLITKINFTKI
jgi:hypothetical protein